MANTRTTTTPALAPSSARRRSHSSDSTPPRAAPKSTGGPRISPIRRGMYSGTLAMPVTRSRVRAVWRVLVSDHSGSPVTARSLRIHASGAASASRVRVASCRTRGAAVRAGRRVREEAPAGGSSPSGRASREPRTPRPPAAAGRPAPAARHGRAGAWPARLDEQGTEHEQHVGDVHVGAHPVGEDRHAREQDGAAGAPAARPNQSAAQPVDDPAASRQREEAEPDRHVGDRMGPQGDRAPRREAPPADGAWGRSAPRTRGSRRARAGRPRRAHRGCRSWRTPRR